MMGDQGDIDDYQEFGSAKGDYQEPQAGSKEAGGRTLEGGDHPPGREVLG
jgi:hypothetical protein